MNSSRPSVKHQHANSNDSNKQRHSQSCNLRLGWTPFLMSSTHSLSANSTNEVKTTTTTATTTTSAVMSPPLASVIRQNMSNESFEPFQLSLATLSGNFGHPNAPHSLASRLFSTPLSPSALTKFASNQPMFGPSLGRKTESRHGNASVAVDCPSDH